MMPGYTIEKLLGRGGMGAVYRGVQTNLDRPVAIKILPPGVEREDPTFAERFKSEAKLMAKLMHPGIVAVFDFGTTLGGQLYFAMEYVDGSDVSQMITAQKKLPQEHALAIIAHMCDALGAAHKLGIVHRDIKPANVLINQEGQVKIADFGLAKIEDPNQHGMTKTGYAMGTPDFVSPEALTLGTAIDGRADIYALGVMLYQMLTGQIPRGAWQPASVISPGTDPRFDVIIVKAMQYDREQRYQSSMEMRQALDVILTVPYVRPESPAASVVPAAEAAQIPGQRTAARKPVGKAPQSRSADAPVRQPAQAGAGTSAPVRSKTPLFIGIAAAAAIGIGAFVMFGAKKDAKPASNGSQTAATNTTSKPPSVTPAEPPPATPAKAAPPPKSTPPSAAPQSTPAPAFAALPDPDGKPADMSKPVKVFILLGSDGMLGNGKIGGIGQPGTLENAVKKQALYPFLVDGTGNWTERKDVRNVSVMRAPKSDEMSVLVNEWLKVTGREIGPEIGIGHMMGHALEEPVLVLKSCNGNRSLGWDLLPPGGKGFEFSEAGTTWTYPGYKESPNRWAKGTQPKKIEWYAGKQYDDDIAYAKAVLAALDKYYPGATKHEIGGFFFWQGLRDLGDAGHVSRYEQNLVQFIEQVRRDFNAPGAPFVCATLGEAKKGDGGNGGKVLAAQLAVDGGSGKYPQFKGNVATVYTHPLAHGTTASGHYGGNALAYMDVGLGMGDVMLGLLRSASPAAATSPSAPPPATSNPIKISDLSTWTGPRRAPANQSWRVDDGVATSTTRTTLWSPESYDDFVIELEWKVEPKGNGGVFYCVQGTDEHGLEMQLADSANAGSALSGGLYGIKMQTRDASKAVGEWNTAKLVVQDAKREHWVNGELVCAYDAASAEFKALVAKSTLPTKPDITRRSGRLVLQAQGAGVSYRNLRIRQPDEPPAPAVVAAPSPSPAALPPELAALNGQFLALQKERVTAPFEADLAKLNASYLGGMDRAIASEKAAGRLDGILALEAEKKLITAGQPVPETDDNETPESLKALRAIYHSERAKLVDQRTANLKTLTDSLDKRLEQMEVDFTRANRVADAKSVRVYRDALRAGSPASTPSISPTPPPSASTAPAPQAPPNPVAANPLTPAQMADLKDGYTNSLGMKFVLVKDTDVMFCIHETRYKDYAAYDAEVAGVDANWKDQTFEAYKPTDRVEEHPVGFLSWNDAQAFCAWLSKKEGKTYRLPTDREWSYAVGVGREEKWKPDSTPATIVPVPNEYPWGDKWPPPKNSGNFADESRKAKAIKNIFTIDGFNDGYVTTAPVMSFKPNKFGLYDMAGNASEWVDDWYDASHKNRTLRGGCFADNNSGDLLSSSRNARAPGFRYPVFGFRCVLVPSPAAAAVQ